MSLTILVPRGAEEAAVRRGAGGASVVAFAAGAASATLPAFADDAFAVVMGLCGSLAGARVGDVVSYTRVLDETGAEQLDAGDLAAVGALVPRARPVVACMTPRVVTRAVERTALAARFGAAVVDMEGLYVARALRERGVRFAMLRVVSDDPRADLPPIEDALGADGAIRPVALATAFVRAPLAFVRFVRDVQTSLGVLASTATLLASGAAGLGSGAGGADTAGAVK